MGHPIANGHCVFLAAVNRSDAKTRNNANSSRSHAIFTVILTQFEGDAVTTSKLHLVDLAGSERVYKHAGVDGVNGTGIGNGSVRWSLVVFEDLSVGPGSCDG